LALAIALWRNQGPAEHRLVRLTADLGPDSIEGTNLSAAISPDGTRLIYSVRGADGTQRLASRLLEQSQATVLPGTENSKDPFFSPDGQWVGFFAGGLLKKISVQGGAPVTLCDAPFGWGAAWGEGGEIVVARLQIGPLSLIPAGGGAPQRLTTLSNGELTHRWPQILPGGQTLLFTTAPNVFRMDGAAIESMSLKTGARKTLLHGGYYARYLPSGHLVYLNQGVLFGVAFDPDKLEVRGAPLPLIEDVAGNPSSGGGQFDFSRTGTLVYLPGKGKAPSWTVDWLDSSGKTTPLLKAPAAYYLPRLSPDGRRLAVQMNSPGSADVYVYDWQRDSMTRLTFTELGLASVWSPNGKYIAYQSTATKGYAIHWIRSDGGGEPQVLLESQNSVVPWSISPDGRRLAYHEGYPDTGYDVMTVSLDLTDPAHPKVGKPEPFLKTQADELVPAFSPDGRWLAYRSTESGVNEIYVRPFPGPGGKWQISTGGGLYVFWSTNRRELFFENMENQIMVLDYTANGDTFTPGKPRLWSDRKLLFPSVSNLDLAPDGKHFVVFPLPETPQGGKTSLQLTFLQNFFDELKRKVPRP
jgi:serine/threonine-protein kinase